MNLNAIDYISAYVEEGHIDDTIVFLFLLLKIFIQHLYIFCENQMKFSFPSLLVY